MDRQNLTGNTFKTIDQDANITTPKATAIKNKGRLKKLGNFLKKSANELISN